MKCVLNQDSIHQDSALINNMKTYTDEEIRKRFKEVIPKCYNWHSYSPHFNNIRLNGEFSSDELREIARVMDEIHKTNTSNEEDVDFL